MKLVPSKSSHKGEGLLRDLSSEVGRQALGQMSALIYQHIG
ncbi:uncharacterized protein METZ01_LOCUS43753 [marine metagenome]|uniref:Uncharacterized protein n=1 Tax=marine metagenome TaxID=408172 RepID=A0A381RIZ6_9ZZZZ